MITDIMLHRGTIFFEGNDRLNMFTSEFDDIDILNLQTLILQNIYLLLSHPYT